VTEFLLHDALAREQADLGTVEAGTEQLVDCALQVLTAVEYPNRFPDGDGRRAATLSLARCA
jgi:hypothetical protein